MKDRILPTYVINCALSWTIFICPLIVSKEYFLKLFSVTPADVEMFIISCLSHTIIPITAIRIWIVLNTLKPKKDGNRFELYKYCEWYAVIFVEKILKLRGEEIFVRSYYLFAIFKVSAKISILWQSWKLVSAKWICVQHYHSPMCFCRICPENVLDEIKESIVKKTYCINIIHDFHCILIWCIHGSSPFIKLKRKPKIKMYRFS